LLKDCRIIIKWETRNNKTSVSQQPLVFHTNSTVGENAVRKIEDVLGQVGCI